MELHLNGCVKMSVLPIEEKKLLLIYYENHSTQETADRYGVSKETVLEYSHRYDLNNDNLENLMDKRYMNRHTNAASPSEEEMIALYESLRIGIVMTERKMRWSRHFIVCTSKINGLPD